jgi:hypothetical protein
MEEDGTSQPPDDQAAKGEETTKTVSPAIGGPEGPPHTFSVFGFRPVPL